MWSPYKALAKNHIMKNFADKIITGFFVLAFGLLWYFTKYSVKENHYTVIVYDVFGEESQLDGVRTDFKTKQVAQSYIREYKDRFSHYDFSIKEVIPEFKRSVFSHR